MAVYKFNKSFKGRIVPMPGDIVELDRARLKVVGDELQEGCHVCARNNPFCHVDIDHTLVDRLCLHTACNGATREDGLDIHYEEVKDEERV